MEGVLVTGTAYAGLETGVALREGHPVYFVMFFQYPEPGQTLNAGEVAIPRVAATVILRTVEELPAVTTWVAMVQKEVGERFAAGPGSGACPCVSRSMASDRARTNAPTTFSVFAFSIAWKIYARSMDIKASIKLYA